MISERLNGNKVNEDASSTSFPTLEEFGFEETEEVDVMDPVTLMKDDNIVGAEENTIHSDEPIDNTSTTNVINTTEVEEPIGTDTVEITNAIDPVENTTTEEPVMGTQEPTLSPSLDAADKADTLNSMDSTLAPSLEAEPTLEPSFHGESDTELSVSIDKLIAETAKRKIVESNDLHFLKFLNKAQVDGYYSLTNEEQDLVKIHVNNSKNYYNAKDVLGLIQEALSVKNETLENRIVRLMPDSVKPVWENLNESTKKSVLSQAKLYPDLTNESAIEHFWYTRNINKPEASSKKLVSHDSLIQEDKLSDTQVNAILERIKRLK
jgi:hypothetical protein